MLEVYFANEYIRALIVFLIAFVVLRLLIVFITRVLPRLVSKTETKIDDVILKRASGPFTIIAILAGVRLAIGEIDISETWNVTVDGILLTLMIFAGAILIYYIIDTLIVVGMTELGDKSRKRINESLLQFFHSILKIMIVVATLLVILASWGIEIGPLLAGLGVAGIAIAFALQSTLSNVFGGISMLLDRSINVGDLVDLDDGTVGHIMKINLRSTKVQTLNNKLVIVPNGKLSESNIKNVALPTPETRVIVPFGVEYGADIAEVKKLVLGELKKVKGLLKDENKKPAVRFVEMADSALNFKAYFYIESFDGVPKALDDANTRIYNALNKARIGIPFPQMDVHLKKK